MVNPLKSAYIFHTAITDSINNYIHHGEKQPLQGIGGGHIFLKHSDACALPVVELIDIVENTQDLNYHKLWYLFFVFWDFTFKVCNTAWIMPRFCEQSILVNFYSVILR